jgi:hypothetical protein
VIAPAVVPEEVLPSPERPRALQHLLQLSVVPILHALYLPAVHSPKAKAQLTGCEATLHSCMSIRYATRVPIWCVHSMHGDMASAMPSTQTMTCSLEQRPGHVLSSYTRLCANIAHSSMGRTWHMLQPTDTINTILVTLPGNWHGTGKGTGRDWGTAR